MLPFPRRLAEASLLAILITILYFKAGEHGVPVRAPPQVPVDLRIPLVMGTIWLYLPGYVGCFLLCVAALEDRRAFRSALVAFLAVAVVATGTFVTWPVPSPPRAPVPTGTATFALLGWLYAHDPPANAFPSLHVANAGMCAAITASTHPRWRWTAWTLAIAVIVSTLTLRQHWVADVVGGAALGAVGVMLWRGLARPPTP